MTLTPRERTILELAWADMPVKAQAVQLGISEAAVKAYRLRVCRKAATDTILKAIKKALHVGLLRA